MLQCYLFFRIWRLISRITLFQFFIYYSDVIIVCGFWRRLLMSGLVCRKVSNLIHQTRNCCGICQRKLGKWVSNLIHLSMSLFPLLIQMKAYAVLIRRNSQVSKHTHSRRLSSKCLVWRRWLLFLPNIFTSLLSVYLLSFLVSLHYHSSSSSPVCLQQTSSLYHVILPFSFQNWGRCSAVSFKHDLTAQCFNWEKGQNIPFP